MIEALDPATRSALTAASVEYRKEHCGRPALAKPLACDVFCEMRRELLLELLSEIPRIAIRAQMVLEDGDDRAAFEFIGALVSHVREIARTGREMREAA